ncbi:MAG TPA: hydroxymethylbilane synthase [Xanthomonadaceae bacterium]|nr:hydroxymethylbilane synthase [Xanthomonadaceae bacterium]
MKLTIATRQSALALWQAEHAATLLRQAHKDLEVELLPMTTRGDQILDRPLAKVGGKGLFLKELERALLDGRADIAVHSMKDVPAVLDEGLEVPVLLQRADPRDALVSRRFDSLQSLPQGARVGTSSLRRQVQLRAARPDLELHDLRGNVGTRLDRLDRGDFDAILLAAAGLDRLGLSERIRQRLDPPDWLPAVAQGAIGIECRAGDDRILQWLAPLHHADTARLVAAERAMNRELGGSCEVPVAGHAWVADGRLHLAGLVGHLDSARVLRSAASGGLDEAAVLGQRVAADLVAQGATELLAP